MLADRDQYVPLMHSNQNTFDVNIDVEGNSQPDLKGLMILYIGSSKNKRSHAIEFKAGSKVTPQNYKFKYTDPEQSKIVLSLYNRKSFWTEDVEIGHMDIPVSEFSTDGFETKEIQFKNRGPKLMIHGSRTENF